MQQRHRDRDRCQVRIELRIAVNKRVVQVLKDEAHNLLKPKVFPQSQ